MSNSSQKGKITQDNELPFSYDKKALHYSNNSVYCHGYSRRLFSISIKAKEFECRYSTFILSNPDQTTTSENKKMSSQSQCLQSLWHYTEQENNLVHYKDDLVL